MSKVYSWVKANKLSLNIDKRNFMLFTPKGFSRTMGNILIDGHQISEVIETKFLGVIIDNNLKWFAHIQYISKNNSKCIGVMVKARKVFERNTLLSLYNSLILPYLNYCIPVCCKAYNTHLYHLIKMQNKAVRLITGVTPRTNTDPLYAALNIMPLTSLYMYAIGLFMYKFSNEMLPELFANMFIHVDEVHSYNTRNSANSHLYTSFHITRRGQKCVKYTGPHVWNLVLSKINRHCSIDCFKKSLVSLLKECSLSDLTSWNSFQCPVASLYKLV